MSFANTRTESEFRAALREKGIDLVLRLGDEGRIYGATFIDHNQRAVLNGSRLGKEFSANVLNERFVDNSPREDIQATVAKHSANQHTTTNLQLQSASSETNDAVGSLFSVFTPEVAGSDNKQPTLKRKKKKKRRYGRQQ